MTDSLMLARCKDRPGGLVDKGMEESVKHSSSAPQTLRPTAIFKGDKK